MKILIDNGHGAETKGKRSPDGRLLEWKYTREIAAETVKRLKEGGYDAELLVPEDKDVSLTERARRTNSHCRSLGKQNVVLVSIHVNAAGYGTEWMNATGWSGWVAPNASLQSKELARIFYSLAENYGLKGNRAVPSERYWTGNFTVLTKTLCPAVLTENLFQDNQHDVDFLLSDMGRETIIRLHVEAIKTYVNSKEQSEVSEHV